MSTMQVSLERPTSRQQDQVHNALKVSTGVELGDSGMYVVPTSMWMTLRRLERDFGVHFLVH